MNIDWSKVLKIGAGVAAVGAAGYGAYRAIKRKKARKAEIDAEVDKFLKNNYKKD